LQQRNPRTGTPQEQMDVKLRPWVGNIDDKSPSIWDNGQIVSVYFKRFDRGDNPAIPFDM
jgi:hypothetical protein